MSAVVAVFTAPLFAPQTVFQLLDFAFQLGDSYRGTRLTLHVNHTTPQLLQLQRQT